MDTHLQTTGYLLYIHYTYSTHIHMVVIFASLDLLELSQWDILKSTKNNTQKIFTLVAVRCTHVIFVLPPRKRKCASLAKEQTLSLGICHSFLLYFLQGILQVLALRESGSVGDPPNPQRRVRVAGDQVAGSQFGM